jgi:hypothetical protein
MAMCGLGKHPTCGKIVVWKIAPTVKFHTRTRWILAAHQVYKNMLKITGLGLG